MSSLPLWINGRQYLNYEHFRVVKAEAESRRAAFEAGPGKLAQSDAGRAAIDAARLAPPPVDRVEIAPPTGKYVDPSLNEARINARVNGELEGQANKTGGVDFEVPQPSIYGNLVVKPIGFFSGE